MNGLLVLLFAMFLSDSVTAQDPAKQRLEKSPRHQEWVVVNNGERKVHCFVVYPESKEKSTVIIVIHENRGLTDWVRSVADQLSEHGYIAVAPDLLSGMAAGGGKTSDFPSEDAAREAIHQLKQEQVTSDLQAVANYAIQLPASNGKLAVSGFCWGGGQAFRFATNRPDLKAAFVFYGTFEHTREDLARIKCPVYGFYGGDDARINTTIPATAATMKELGKTFEPVIYDGAGHGFMRSGEEPEAIGANRKARADAWERWKKRLSSI